MCPNTLRLYLAIIAVLAVYYFVYKKISRCACENFDALGTLVSPSHRTNSFSQAVFTGFYKGRRVEFQCSFFDKGDPRRFWIEPKIELAPQKLFLFDYPRPTKNTKLVGRKIFYSRSGFFKTESYYKVYSREEFVVILEELSEAAHRVETGVDFKTGKGAYEK
ncbi:MAG: hypothetical protein MUC52_02630 [Candidatus Omnitrophica bacterium]|jgi:hypothetical protein|nr:hypothetical protein [Candidatus Omnitrophota bacterium]